MWCLLLWTTELIWLQVVQIFYGTFMAAEVAYYTYCYAKVDKENYQKVTSHTRAAITGGRFFSALIGQLLYSYNVDLRQLNFITLASKQTVRYRVYGLITLMIYDFSSNYKCLIGDDLAKSEKKSLFSYGTDI